MNAPEPMPLASPLAPVADSPLVMDTADETPFAVAPATLQTPAATASQVSHQLAGQMAAGLKKLQADAFKAFPVPGWDDLRIIAKKVGDTERDDGDTTVKTIALSTHAVEMRTPDGNWIAVEHGWRGVALMIGDSEMSTSDVIRKVLDNGARLDAFASVLVGWMLGHKQLMEQRLGE